jgi:exo-beta-1,3-glucanase (GH17 family)
VFAAWLFVTAFAVTPLQAKLCLGVAYSPFHANQTPAHVEQLSQQQILEDMPHLAALAENLRTYGVSGAQAQLPQFAHRYGLRTWVGGWLGRDQQQNEEEMRRLVTASQQPGVAAVIVGNEVLYRKDLSPAELIRYIRGVKAKVRVPVACADGWYTIRTNPNVVAAADIALINVHPYWDGLPVEQAARYVFDRYQYVKDRYPGKQVVIGEVGWPSAGPARKGAEPSEENEATFLHSFLDLAKSHPQVKYFLFSSYDEYWKEEGGSTVGTHWGVYYADGSTKRALAGLLASQAPQPDRLAAAGLVMENGKLMPGLDMGVNTSEGMTKWVTAGKSELVMAYPAGQEWGAVFITVGRPTPQPNQRGQRDYSRYSSLVLELKGGRQGESIAVGLKTPSDPDDGSEPRYVIKGISDQWQSYRVPLEKLCDAKHPRERLRQVYVVTEFVFTDGQPHTLAVRSIRYEAEDGQTTAAPAPAPGSPRPRPGDVYVGKKLVPGYDMGVNTSEGRTDWVIDHQGYMECRYPAGQSWGAVFITVGRPTPTVMSRRTKDVSAFHYLTLELKGEKSGETVWVGMKTQDDPDDGQEPKYAVRNLPREWRTIRIPLASLVQAPDYPKSRLRHIYVACELVFEPEVSAETAFFRNVRFE